MSGVTFVESGMTFGPYEEKALFRIETSQFYHDFGGNKPKVAEFLLVKTAPTNKTKVLIVEAKTNAPKDPDKSLAPDISFTEEIRQKMLNTLLMFLGLRVGRFGESSQEIPSGLRGADLASIDVLFVLVVKNHKNDWLTELRSKMEPTFLHLRKSFKMPTPFFLVLNEEKAKAAGLVS